MNVVRLHLTWLVARRLTSNLVLMKQEISSGETRKRHNWLLDGHADGNLDICAHTHTRIRCTLVLCYKINSNHVCIVPRYEYIVYIYIYMHLQIAVF